MKILIFTIALLLIGCSSEETITFGFESSVAADIAIEMMQKENIWYKQKKNDKYEFRKKDFQRIQEIYADATNQIIPFGRSSGYGPEMFEIMVKKLKSQGVPYKVTNYLGENWIIWEEEDQKRIKEIENMAKNELIETLMK